MAEQKKKKQKNKADKMQTTKVILSTDEETEDEEDLDEDEDAGGIHLEKEDVLVIYKALKSYKPTTGEEDQLRDIWLEQFDMILVATHGKPMD
jgi:hypothetical protein